MTEAQLKLAGEIISDWSQMRGDWLENFKKLNEDLMEKFTKQRKEFLDDALLHWKNIVEEFPTFMEEIKEFNRTTGADFNSLKFFEPGETMHSFLVAHLLNPRASHGQGNLFLKKFLELIEIESPETKNWAVTAEEGRVDIMLKRKHPHSIIIIENKSNWAGDQPNQLYRYWHENIYTALKDRPIDYAQQNKVRYRVIYLPPNDSKQPEGNSLERPAYLDEQLPLKLPMDVELRTFSGFVVQWLELCIPEIPDSNYRLREYVKQYIELWKN